MSSPGGIKHPTELLPYLIFPEQLDCSPVHKNQFGEIMIIFVNNRTQHITQLGIISGRRNKGSRPTSYASERSIDRSTIAYKSQSIRKYELEVLKISVPIPTSHSYHKYLLKEETQPTLLQCPRPT